jgi:hypothetical protein
VCASQAKATCWQSCPACSASSPKSLVVLGLKGDRGRIEMAMRYDLPPAAEPAEIAEHAADSLTRAEAPRTIAIGYGTGQQVTPVMDAVRARVAEAGVLVHEALRVDEGRYWSYLCQDPACHPGEGTPLGPEHLEPGELSKLGDAKPHREDLTAAVAPVVGERREEMREAYASAAAEAREQYRNGGTDALWDNGVRTVSSVISTYREGGEPSDQDLARAGMYLKDIRVRDAAWAQMDSEHAAAHTRLWADATRTAAPGFVAAPASLMAFTAYQQGKGALANIALDRAEEDQPGYSMAGLVRQVVSCGIRPSELEPPMTPEDVATSYGVTLPELPGAVATPSETGQPPAADLEAGS